MKNIKQKTVQDISVRQVQDRQDKIFQKMSVEKKIKLASDFFRFARNLNPEGILYGARKVIEKSRRNS